MTAAPLSPHDWEMLTAYLDGELSALAREDLEKQLEREPELRSQLAMLQKTWDALALLEPVGTNPVLTSTTLQYVTQVSVSDPADPPKSLRGYFWLGLIAGIALLMIPWFSNGKRHEVVAPIVVESPPPDQGQSPGFSLTRVDERRLMFWLDRFMSERYDEVVSALPNRLQRQLKSASPQAARAMLRRAFRRQPDRFELPMSDIEQLIDQLSLSAQNQLTQAPSAEARRAMVKEWILTVLNQRQLEQRTVN